jgi:hypothetical protein
MFISIEFYDEPMPFAAKIRPIAAAHAWNQLFDDDCGIDSLLEKVPERRLSEIFGGLAIHFHGSVATNYYPMPEQSFECTLDAGRRPLKPARTDTISKAALRTNLVRQKPFRGEYIAETCRRVFLHPRGGWDGHRWQSDFLFCQ